MDMQVQLAGTVAKPSGKGSLEIINGSVAGVRVDKINAELALKNDTIQLEYLVAT